MKAVISLENGATFLQDHIYSVFIQLDHGFWGYESFVCAIIYSDEYGDEDFDLSLSTFRYSTCDMDKYSDIS